MRRHRHNDWPAFDMLDLVADTFLWALTAVFGLGSFVLATIAGVVLPVVVTLGGAYGFWLLLQAVLANFVIGT